MTDTRTPVEVTTRYATSVDTLTDAFAFVMDRIDTVGEAPTIRINPIWAFDLTDADDEGERRFEVVVEGMTQEARP